jgi:DNA helicase-2/ATP-dependent DNA helicase PcrA
LRWLRDERIADRALDTRAALAQLDEIWMADGPRGHLYEAEYRRIAEGMVARAVDRAAGGGPLIDPNWQVSLTNGQVRFRPDQVEVLEDGTVVVRRLRTGRPTDKDGKEDIYALYQVAAAEAFPGARIRIETLYLSTGETREVRLSEKMIDTRLNRYDKAIAGIRRGEFPANLSSRDCPRCPYYFICSTGKGA